MPTMLNKPKPSTPKPSSRTSSPQMNRKPIRKSVSSAMLDKASDDKKNRNAKMAKSDVQDSEDISKTPGKPE